MTGFLYPFRNEERKDTKTNKRFHGRFCQRCDKIVWPHLAFGRNFRQGKGSWDSVQRLWMDRILGYFWLRRSFTSHLGLTLTADYDCYKLANVYKKLYEKAEYHIFIDFFQLSLRTLTGIYIHNIDRAIAT